MSVELPARYEAPVRLDRHEVAGRAAPDDPPVDGGDGGKHLVGSDALPEENRHGGSTRRWHGGDDGGDGGGNDKQCGGDCPAADRPAGTPAAIDQPACNKRRKAEHGEPEQVPEQRIVNVLADAMNTEQPV